MDSIEGPRRHLAPWAHADDPDEKITLTATDPQVIRRKEMAGAAYDLETLFGAVRAMLRRESKGDLLWVRVSEHFEDIAQSSCVIALSKLRRAEEETGVRALIPEALLMTVVRGAISSRCRGDGRTLSTESSRARALLNLWRHEEITRGRTPSHREVDEKAEEILLSFPAHRRPTIGFQNEWQNVPSETTFVRRTERFLSNEAGFASTPYSGEAKSPWQSAWDDPTFDAACGPDPDSDDVDIRLAAARRRSNPYGAAQAVMDLPRVRASASDLDRSALRARIAGDVAGAVSARDMGLLVLLDLSDQERVENLWEFLDTLGSSLQRELLLASSLPGANPRRRSTATAAARKRAA